MAKRFIASELWNKDWFLELPSKYKVLWVYMITKCDVAGVFDPNLKTVSKLLNEKYTEQEVFIIFDGKIRKVQDKWLLVKFINFQYGENISPHMVKPINNALRKIGLDLDTVLTQYKESINTLQDIDKEKEKDIYIDIRGVIGEIINDLNLVLGTSYKPNSSKTQELIKARLNEGFVLEDFKQVHRKMTQSWGIDNKMRQYLRPLTLYSNKFESYLNRPADIRQLTTAQQNSLKGLAELKKEISNDKPIV